LYTARMVECFNAAADGHLDLLKQLRESGYSWDEWTCALAAQNGHIEILQWARKNGCHWDEWTCAYAARNGHHEILQWARKNGCPWDKQTCINAATNKRIEVLQWAIVNGCDHNHIFVLTPSSRKACVEGGVFPGYGCLVADCPDTEKNEGLCAIHKAAICSTLLTLVCNDVAQLILEIVCAPN